MRNLFIILGLYCFAVACSSNSNEAPPDVSHITVQLDIQRLEQALFQCRNKTDVNDFLKHNTLFTKKFLNHNDYIHDSLLVNSLYQLIQNVYMDTLYQEVQHIFKDFSTIK